MTPPLSGAFLVRSGPITPHPQPAKPRPPVPPQPPRRPVPVLLVPTVRATLLPPEVVRREGHLLPRRRPPEPLGRQEAVEPSEVFLGERNGGVKPVVDPPGEAALLIAGG